MHRESYTSVQCRDPAEFSVPDLISEEDVGNVCCGQMSSSVIMFEFSFPSSISSAKANTCYVVGSASVQTSWGTCIWVKVPLMWRQILGLYRDINCHQDDIFHRKQDNARSHSAGATTEWFLTTLSLHFLAII